MFYSINMSKNIIDSMNQIDKDISLTGGPPASVNAIQKTANKIMPAVIDTKEMLNQSTLLGKLMLKPASTRINSPKSPISVAVFWMAFTEAGGPPVRLMSLSI